VRRLSEREGGNAPSLRREPASEKTRGRGGGAEGKGGRVKQSSAISCGKKKKSSLKNAGGSQPRGPQKGKYAEAPGEEGTGVRKKGGGRQVRGPHRVD